MDVGAFVQENRRWLLGAAGGGLAWLIGSAIVGSLYDGDAAWAATRGITKSAGDAQLYDSSVLSAAKAEADELTKERERLQSELVFNPSPKYTLPAQGAPDEYLFQVGRALKQSIFDGANERDVVAADKDVGWDAPTSVDEIRSVLFGLDLIDEFKARLFAAHDAVRAARPEATGLRALQLCKLDSRRSARTTKTTRPGEVDLRDLIVQERVTFQFQSDEETWMRFVESCRQPGRTLVLETFQVQAPARIGEPCSVKGVLQGITFK